MKHVGKQNYDDFVEKFKPKKTTDDCYTPPLVYDAIADWVANEYNLSRDVFVRPFYPGGNYESFDYSGVVVVDNPPFSILSKIIDFYISHGVKFFLFAPTLTLFGILRDRECSALVVNGDITYANGARVHTSFITNLEPQSLRFRTVSRLYQVIKQATEDIKKEQVKQMAKYIYPSYVMQAARLQTLTKYGIDIRVKKSESSFISRLDSQIKKGKTVFGGGYLVSEGCKAEKEKAEKEKAEKWQLSDREIELIKSLG